MVEMTWSVYLSGEIHSDWRNEVLVSAKQNNLPIEFTSPITNHQASDDCGVHILGEEGTEFWKDHKGAKINGIRNKTLIENADIVIVKFGEKYRQWNAAFDAGYAAALGTPIITLHDKTLTHALKEIDGVALAHAESPEQIVDILSYVVKGILS